MHVLAGDVLSDPPHGHNSRKVGVTTVTDVTATQDSYFGIVREARRDRCQSYARFTDSNRATRSGD